VRDRGEIVAHIELSCGDHCRDAEESSESAPVPARRESPIAARIPRLATGSQSVISRVTEVGSKFRNALLVYGFLDRSHSEDLLRENEFCSPYYTYYRSMVLDTNLNLYDGASAQGLSVLRYFE
jgi:hypothetical protein